MTGRTWIVLADSASTIRTPETDELAAAADGGLSVYVTKVGLPEYLGVWLAPNGGLYHLYSDYPRSQHERFGWKSIAL